MQKVRYYLSFNSLRIKFQYLFQIFDGPINLVLSTSIRKLDISSRGNKTLPYTKVRRRLKVFSFSQLTKRKYFEKCFFNIIFLQDWRKRLRLSKQLS